MTSYPQLAVLVDKSEIRAPCLVLLYVEEDCLALAVL